MLQLVEYIVYKLNQNNICFPSAIHIVIAYMIYVTAVLIYCLPDLASNVPFDVTGAKCLHVKDSNQIPVHPYTVCI